MREGARVQAAMEVLSDIEARRRPAGDALKDWGLSHRFAGSKDRAAIASLVYDGLRHRASSAWIMGAAEARAVVLATLSRTRGLTAERIAGMFDGDAHAPAPPTADEAGALANGSLAEAPSHVRGDYPEWLHPSFERAFGEGAAEEGAGLARRAPLDLRANSLKAERDKVATALSALHPKETPFSPLGLRIAPAEETGRTPHVQSEEGFVKGWFEIQDEGSQLASLLSGAAPGAQVADICAGAGGKTLALAGLMGNKGQIFATDTDKRQLAPIYDRLTRAGVRNAQVRAPAGPDVLSDLNERLDLVVVDAPCTGTGTWRRNPDAKWRVRPGALEQRLKQQVAALETAARLVRPGGRIAYITCSVLPEENEDQVAAFLRAHPDFATLDMAGVWHERLGGEPPLGVLRGTAIQLTPRRAGTDGFYVGVLERRA